MLSMTERNIIVLGTPAVGKSALVLRYVTDEFLETYDPTIEDTYRKTGAKDFTIFDTGCQKEYPMMIETWIQKGDGFILVYDITAKDTFQDIKNYFEDTANALYKKLFNIPILLVGTKLDLANKRQVSTKEAQAFAKKLGCPILETSAKDTIKVAEVFQTMTTLILEAGASGGIKVAELKNLMKACDNLEAELQDNPAGVLVTSERDDVELLKTSARGDIKGAEDLGAEPLDKPAGVLVTSARDDAELLKTSGRDDIKGAEDMGAEPLDKPAEVLVTSARDDAELLGTSGRDKIKISELPNTSAPDELCVGNPYQCTRDIKGAEDLGTELLKTSAPDELTVAQLAESQIKLAKDLFSDENKLAEYLEDIKGTEDQRCWEFLDKPAEVLVIKSENSKVKHRIQMFENMAPQEKTV